MSIDWVETFQNYIDSFLDINQLDPNDIRNKLGEVSKESLNNYFIFKDIKLKTGWITKDNISLKSNFYDDFDTYTLGIIESTSDHNKIKSIFEDYFKKKLYTPFNKLYLANNYKINKVKLDKIKYFIEHETRDNKIEYIKFNPDFNNKLELKKLIQRSDIKLLFKPILSNLTVIEEYDQVLTYKIDSIIINYNPKELFKYSFIKRIFEARRAKNKEEFTEYIKKIKDDRVYIDNKFNGFKFSKNKLKDSNNRIIDMLNG